MATIQYPESHTYTQTVFVPEHPVRRWLLPLVVGFATFLIGVTIGSVGSGSDVGNCAELAEEYQMLVSEGIDAGMSMDEAWVAQVADRRDQLAEVMEVECG